jgi:hypothetical protein
MAERQAEWAGIPMPLDDQQLVVEPSYPWAEALSRVARKPADDEFAGWTRINSWYAGRYRCEVEIWADPDGKRHAWYRPAFHHHTHDIQTLGASVAWGLEQEEQALALLASMIRPHAYKQYLLTGMFLESSPRSGVTYVFRRLRPTVALAPDRGRGEQMRILCSLCMHPIAHYAGSWAGAMCPTDDVIAHLTMMRGDEAMFWKRSNQHPPYRPEAGL